MYLTSREAAELLRVSQNQLYRLVDTGAIPAFKPAGRLLFNRSSLMSHIESSQVQPKGKPVHITVDARKRRSCSAGAVYRGEKKWVG